MRSYFPMSLLKFTLQRPSFCLEKKKTCFHLCCDYTAYQAEKTAYIGQTTCTSHKKQGAAGLCFTKYNSSARKDGGYEQEMSFNKQCCWSPVSRKTAAIFSSGAFMCAYRSPSPALNEEEEELLEMFIVQNNLCQTTFHHSGMANCLAEIYISLWCLFGIALGQIQTGFQASTCPFFLHEFTATSRKQIFAVIVLFHTVPSTWYYRELTFQSDM